MKRLLAVMFAAVVLAVTAVGPGVAHAAMGPIEQTQWWYARCGFYTKYDVYGGNPHDPTELRTFSFTITAFNCIYPAENRWSMGPRVCSWVDNGGEPDLGMNVVASMNRRVVGGKPRCASPRSLMWFNSLSRTLYCLPGQTLRLTTIVRFDLQAAGDSDASGQRQFTAWC